MDVRKIGVRRHIEDERISFGIVRAKGVEVKESPSKLRESIDALVKEFLKNGGEIPEEVRKKVRHMLKLDGFSPSGRNRPANEFLVKEIQRTKRFKYISNIVDINNFMSLKYSVPISIFDAGKIQGALVLRTGGPGEAYVFNEEGHIIEVKRLVVCCEEQPDYTSIPYGSPVKDSMHTKIFKGCNQALAVIYSPPELYGREHTISICEEMAGLLKAYAGAEETLCELR